MIDVKVNYFYEVFDAASLRVHKKSPPTNR
jgi:hypothetical protein